MLDSQAAPERQHAGLPLGITEWAGELGGTLHKHRMWGGEVKDCSQVRIWTEALGSGEMGSGRVMFRGLQSGQGSLNKKVQDVWVVGALCL